MPVVIIQNSEGHATAIRIMGVEIPVLDAGTVNGPGGTNLIVSMAGAQITYEQIPFPALTPDDRQASAV